MTAEMFPTRIRYSGVAMAAQLALVVTGFAPAIAAAHRPARTQRAGFRWPCSPRACCLVSAAVTALRVRETYKVPTEELGANFRDGIRKTPNPPDQTDQHSDLGKSPHVPPVESDEPFVTTRPVLIDNDVEATMRDGMVLRSTVYRPRRDPRFPVLLTRTPYGRDLSVNSAYFNPITVAAAGLRRDYAGLPRALRLGRRLRAVGQ